MQRVRIVLAGIVTAVWLTGYVLAYVRATDYPAELTGLMAFVLGWAFAGQVKDVVVQKLREAAEKDKEDER